MKNYIIRVYRQDKEDVNKVVGIIEDIEEDLRDSFSSMGEMIRILCGKQKIVSEVTEGELEEMIRSSFSEKNHSGKKIHLNSLKKPGEGKKRK